MNKILEAILADRWAITTEALDSLMAIAFSDLNIEALEKVAGKYLQGTEGFVTVRDGVATLAITGPIFARETFVSWLMGWPSYDTLARDFHAAMSNPDVTSIILQINSPGGQVDGASEFAQHVMAARGVKPVHAYVSGTAASAAYWIASAAERVFAVDTAIIGSIGTQLGITITDGGANGRKSYTFISSQSPLKNADPGTDAGAKELQAMVDALASVFIEAVAAGRNTSPENVVESFGRGGVFVAAEAVKRGMVDGISTYEKVLQSIREGIDTMELENATAADLAAKRPDLVTAIQAEAVAGVEKVDADKVRAEAVAAERARTSGIDAFAVAGAEDVVAACKADGSTPEQAAVKILQHVQAKGLKPAKAVDKTAAELEALKGDEEDLDAPKTPTTDAKDKGGDPVAAVLADASAAGVISNK